MSAVVGIVYMGKSSNGPRHLPVLNTSYASNPYDMELCRMIPYGPYDMVPVCFKNFSASTRDYRHLY